MAAEPLTATVPREQPADPSSKLPRTIGRPATGALSLAGYDSLDRLDGASASELLKLHGVGPVAIARLRAALAATGRSFRD